jgi:hypothetical protein
MNTDSEKAGAQAPCLLCGRPAGEHSRDTADICNCYLAGESDAHKRCAICGFVIDTKYEATKPTIQYGSAGRAKVSPDKLTELQSWLDERSRNSTSYGSHAHAYGVAARKLREVIAS